MIALTVLCCMLSGCGMFLLGSHLSYSRGYGDGWDDSESYAAEADDFADIRWELTAPMKREADVYYAGFSAPSIINDGPVS